MTVRQALKVPGRYGFHSTRSGHAARGVKLVMSDAHEGMKATLANLLKSSWQRCCFDFMRNALAHAARPDGASSPPSKPFAPGRCRGCQDAVAQGRQSVPPQAAEA